MKYRAEIDGLRALAVVPVILFHAGFELFSGGFVGVDVFFVISGYLITTILIDDIEKERFSIVSFYERRARRILPALFFVMLVCVPFAWIWMFPSQMKDFSTSLVAVSLFVSNISFWQESGYFNPAVDAKPLLHTWSLAVEEQYYVLFPIFLTMAWRFGKSRVFWMIVAMGGISLLLSEWGWRNKSIANFYLAPTRAWELLAGSITAFIVQHKGVRKSDILALVGLGAIAFSILAYDKHTPFPSVYGLVPVLGVVLLVLYAHKDTLVAKILGSKAFVGVGLISYSAYLWHQPLFAFARLRMHEPGMLTFILLSIASLLLAIVSWKYVERPFRRKDGLLSSRSLVFYSSIAAVVAFSAIGLMGRISNGFENATEGRKRLADLAAQIEPNPGIKWTCAGSFVISDGCSSGDGPTLLLWGDSFAMHLYEGLRASAPSLGIMQITTNSCSPILGISRLNPSGGNGLSWSNRCLAFNQGAFEWLKRNKTIDLVVISSPFGWVGTERTINSDGDVLDPDFEVALSGLSRTVRAIENLGIEVVVVSASPKSGFDVGQCLIRRYQFNLRAGCDFEYVESSYRHDFFSAVEQSVPVYWLYKDLCTDGVCEAEKGSVFIYNDAVHLSKQGSALIGASNNWYERLRELTLKSKLPQN